MKNKEIPNAPLQIIERFARIYRFSSSTTKEMERIEKEITGYLSTYDIDRMTNAKGALLITFRFREIPKEEVPPTFPSTNLE